MTAVITEKQNALLTSKHLLLCVGDLSYLNQSQQKDLEFIKKNFCGFVLVLPELVQLNYESDTIAYLCANNVEEVYNNIQNKRDNMFFVIKELSNNFIDNVDNQKYQTVSIGEVAINVHNVGVYFRNFFDPNKDYFDLISHEHQFQTLTESNKQTNAYRHGIYLTKVDEIKNETKGNNIKNDDNNNNIKDNEIRFRLLRCSTNFNGPTDNFRATDNEIINKVSTFGGSFFEQPTHLNHVLAQIYHNVTINENASRVTSPTERKARISVHSDKTKDMYMNGLIAFCTFYENYSNNQFNPGFKHVKRSVDDTYDFHYKKVSVLTRLRFKLKNCVNDPKYENQFDVTLYPNSVFIMSLNMNRLYTHEIIPSVLQIDKIPTRMGYVIRCSKTESAYKDNQTYIIEDDGYVKLEERTINNVKELKSLYFRENISDELIEYGNIHFSLNDGDYKKPIV